MSVVVVATILPLAEHRAEVIAAFTETIAQVHEEDGLRAVQPERGSGPADHD